MKIVVCVKPIQNPEIPAAQFRIDEEAKVLIPVSGLSPVLSPFDEQAVEAALRIRDRGEKLGHRNNGCDYCFKGISRSN